MNHNFIFVERDVQTHSLIRSFLKHMPVLEHPEDIKKRLEIRAAHYQAMLKLKHGFASIFHPTPQNSKVCPETGVQLISYEDPVECPC